MLKERLAAVEAVSSTFLPAELAAEQVATNGLRCLAHAIEQRRRLRLSRNTGAQAVELLREITAESLAQLDRIYAAHALLAQVPAEIGLGERAYGDTGCGDNVPRELMAVHQPLRSVA